MARGLGDHWLKTHHGWLGSIKLILYHIPLFFDNAEYTRKNKPFAKDEALPLKGSYAKNISAGEQVDTEFFLPLQSAYSWYCLRSHRLYFPRLSCFFFVCSSARWSIAAPRSSSLLSFFASVLSLVAPRTPCALFQPVFPASEYIFKFDFDDGVIAAGRSLNFASSWSGWGAHALPQRSLRRVIRWPWIEHATSEARGGHSTTELSPP